MRITSIMKKVNRVLDASLMTVIYCFALLVVLNHSFKSSPTFADTQSEIHKNYSSSDSGSLLLHTSQTEVLLSNVNSNLLPTFKNPFQSFSAVLQTEEAIFASVFHQYHRTSANLLIRFRKANLIFPFHYFW
jgi:hypothetical protein